MGVYGHCKRVCTESWLWEKNLSRTRESNLCQQHAGLMLNQLNYIPTLPQPSLRWKKKSCIFMPWIWPTALTNNTWERKSNVRLPGVRNNIIHAYESLAVFFQCVAPFLWVESQHLIWSFAACSPSAYLSELPAPVFATPSPSTAAQCHPVHVVHGAQIWCTSTSSLLEQLGSASPSPK